MTKLDNSNIRQARKPKKVLSSSEILEILNKQWLNTEDIMMIFNVGVTKARQIYYDVMCQDDVIRTRLPSGVLPAKSLINYFDIDLDYLFKVEELHKKSMSMNANSNEHTSVNNPSNLFT